ncbi:MAG: YibE/F family protein [Actinomycetota bacterium]
MSDHSQPDRTSSARPDPPSPDDRLGTHSHSHSHTLEGSWDVWLAVPALRVILCGVIVVAVITVIGLIALWPDGEGRAAAIDEAAGLGLVTEQWDATVTSVVEDQCSYATPENPRECRSFGVVLEEGPESGALVVLPEYDLTAFAPAPQLAVGDRVVIGYEPSTDFYFYADRDRDGTLLLLALLFAVVVIALGRGRGLSALAAMAVTVVVLVGFIAPSVLDGNDPVWVAVIAGSAIAFVSLYLTHGFNPTTTVALAGTLATLILTLVVSSIFFSAANFSGLATEEGLTLPLVVDINLSSLLLGGAVIGALGALDDVTVTQVATVAELHHRNPRLSIPELIASGIRVGRDHIAATVNTLLLAYAGASMPLLLVFAASDQPLGVVANSEIVAIEIVRTLCGSIGLVAAVPVTTIMAAVLVGTSTDHNPDDADPRTPTDITGPAIDGAPTGPPPVTPPKPAAPTDRRPQNRPVPEQAPEPQRPAPSWDDFGPLET